MHYFFFFIFLQLDCLVRFRWFRTSRGFRRFNIPHPTIQVSRGWHRCTFSGGSQLRAALSHEPKQNKGRVPVTELTCVRHRATNLNNTKEGHLSQNFRASGTKPRIQTKQSKGTCHRTFVRAARPGGSRPRRPRGPTDPHLPLRTLRLLPPPPPTSVCIQCLAPKPIWGQIGLHKYVWHAQKVVDAISDSSHHHHHHHHHHYQHQHHSP